MRSEAIDVDRAVVGGHINLAVADHRQVELVVVEENIPIADEVKGACEILGLDPLYVANEGKLLAFVHPDHAEKVLQAMRSHPLGKDARMIGEVVAEPAGAVLMKTRIGGTRVVDMLSGEQLPRIC